MIKQGQGNVFFTKNSFYSSFLMYHFIYGKKAQGPRKDVPERVYGSPGRSRQKPFQTRTLPNPCVGRLAYPLEHLYHDHFDLYPIHKRSQ
jgi:hypothetical protein